jgi:hypothetical protein
VVFTPEEFLVEEDSRNLFYDLWSNPPLVAPLTAGGKVQGTEGGRIEGRGLGQGRVQGEEGGEWNRRRASRRKGRRVCVIEEAERRLKDGRREVRDANGGRREA